MDKQDIYKYQRVNQNSKISTWIQRKSLSANDWYNSFLNWEHVLGLLLAVFCSAYGLPIIYLFLCLRKKEVKYTFVGENLRILVTRL